MVTLAQMMRMLGVGRNTAYELLKTGKIASIRIGRVHRIPKKNIKKYLKSKG